MSGDARHAIALVALLKTCAKQKDLHGGKRTHTQILKGGWIERNVFIGSSLVNLYAKCGALAKAQEVFEELPAWNIVSWNALITGYAQHGHGEKALACFANMQLGSFSPNAVTFTCILKACGSIGALDKGQEIHTQIVREHLLETDIMLAGAVVDMYAKCGAVEKAREVFDELSSQDIVLWTSLITGYAQNGYGEDAVTCFEQMQAKGLSPDAITYSCILKACGGVGALDKGEEVHAQVVSNQLLEKDVVVANALVDMYAKCGNLEKAQEVFDELPLRDIASWNALIAGYTRGGHVEAALNLFELMQHEGFSPDAFTLACILKACGSIGGAALAFQLHTDIVKHGLQEGLDLGIALIVMYVNCCMVEEAQGLFSSLQILDVVSCSALMEGYAQLGNDEVVLKFLDKMIEEGIEPDATMSTIVLNTCNHRGLLDVGQMYFEGMARVYGIIPNVDHHTCLVDLFCRVGLVDKAMIVVTDMPYLPDLALWHTLLGACKRWGSMKLGKWAFEHAVELDETSVSAYVFMSNVHAAGIEAI